MDNIFDEILGPPGTYRRYRHEREVLKLHIKNTFLDFMLLPLQLFPWGHVASRFWFYILTERFHSAMDGMAFSYINDAYVLSVRDYLQGKRLRYKVELEKELLKPYIARPRYPLWLITKIVIPQFKALYKTRKENYS